MKKFSKLLILALSLALLITAFAVVALAADEEEPKLTPVTVTGDNFNFEEKETGFLISQTTDKDGVWYVGEADNGNKYAVAAYDNGTGTAGQNWDPTFHNDSKLGIDKYPIFAFNFDVRSTTGGWHWGLTLRADLYGGPGGANARLSQTTSRKLNGDGFKLSGKGEWNHVTYIVEHAGNGVFNFISYVNGVKTSTTTIDYNATKFSAQYNSNSSIVYFNDLFDENGNIKYSNVRIHCVSMYPPTGETSEEVHYDNLSATYFPAGYSADDVAKYSYNENYEFPYNYTVAKNGDAVYDDVSEAVAAANDGDTILLTTNAAKDIIIDKPMSIDTSNGAFTFDWVSYNGYYLASNEGGLYTFAKAEETVTVNWDPACGGACNCNDAAGGHSLNATTTVALGIVPSHPVQNPSFDVTADKRQAFFVGWSYENDGVVDEIGAITEADLALGEITLYPVYDVKVYALEVTTTAGQVSYFEEDDFKSVVEGIAYQATVKLVRDVNIDSATIKIKRSFTLDLNGYSLKRCFNYGNVYEATKDDNGNFVFGTDNLIETVAIQRDMFTAYGYNSHLIITSSVGGGNLYATNMHCDTWMYDGQVVKRTAKALSDYNTLTTGSGFLVMISYLNESQGFDLTINNGVSIFTGSLWYQDGASHTGFSYVLENMNFYRISPYWVKKGASDQLDIISSRSDEAFDLIVTNCSFYAQSYYSSTGTKLMYLGSNNVAKDPAKMANVIFTNCNILKNNGAYTYSIDNRRANNLNLVFDNCRIFDMGSYGAINGTIQATDSNAISSTAAGEGYTNETISLNQTYKVPGLTFAVDTTSDINAPTYVFKFNNKSFTFNRIATKAVDVNYTDKDGNVIKTEQLRPGVDSLPTAPTVTYELENDPYRNILAEWVDENGKAPGKTLGLDGAKVNWQDSYTFKPVRPTENIQYVGGIKDIFFNLSFTANFRYNIYLPAYDEDLVINGIEGFEKAEAVKKIDGYEYVVYYFVANTATASDDTVFVIDFTYGGVAYKQTLKVNALLYADIILATSDVAEEKLAVGNMARFVMEARNYSSLEVDEERFGAILDAAGVADYATSYDGNGNIETLSEYIHSVSYVIYNGAAYYKFVLTDASYAESISFTLNGEVLKFTANGAELILENVRVYDVIDTITITVNGKSATYSILDNIEANPSENLLKALYEFGLAAESYREYIEANS